MTAPQLLGDLQGVEVEAGVNDRGEPFVAVRAFRTDGSVLRGQLTPDETRAFALSYFRMAEAAEQDAAVFARLADGEKGQQTAAMVVTLLRDLRP